MIDELQKLRELTQVLTGNGYLKDQAEEWKDALDAIPDAVYIIDKNFRVKYMNKVLYRRLGIPQIDILDKPCYALIHGIDTDEFEEVWKEKAHLEFLPEIYIAPLDGWFNMTKSPIVTKGGKLLGFICVLQDITAELEAKKALEEQEGTLKALFDAAPIGMGLVDMETLTFHSVNQYLLELLKYSKEELIGRSHEILYKDRGVYYEVTEAILNPGSTDIVTGVDTFIFDKYGKPVDVLIRVSNIGKTNLMVFTILDLTEKRSNEKELALNEDRLESTLKLSKMTDRSEEDVVRFALEEAVRLTSSEIGYLHFVNDEKDVDGNIDLNLFLWSESVQKDCKTVVAKKYPLSLAGCWAGCVTTKSPVIHNDYQSNFEGKKGLPEGHIHLVRHMSVPVIDDGEVVAIAGVGNKEGYYNKADVRQLGIFMNSMWEIISKNRMA